MIDVLSDEQANKFCTHPRCTIDPCEHRNVREIESAVVAALAARDGVDVEALARTAALCCLAYSDTANLREGDVVPVADALRLALATAEARHEADETYYDLQRERDSLRARVLQMHAANSELLHDADGLRTQLHLANVDAANREAEANDLRARVKQLEHGYDELRTVCNRQQHQLAAAQRVPADAELDAIVDDIVTESAFCDSNGWSRTSLMLERAHESITALRRWVADLQPRLGPLAGDSARLDWLIANASVAVSPDDETQYLIQFGYVGDAREAIDAAIAKEPQDA